MKERWTKNIMRNLIKEGLKKCVDRGHYPEKLKAELLITDFKL